MSKIIFVLVSVLAVFQVTSANAAVIQCEGVDGDVRFDITVENLADQTTPALHVVSMRASDPNVSEARSEVAVFDAVDGLVSGGGDVVVGYVDDANPKTGRKGERIGGTTLGQLRSIMIRFDVGLIEAAISGKKHAAEVLYLKKIGHELVQDLDCALQK